MNEETLRKLTELAGPISTPQRKVSPMQIAAQLLEDSLRGQSGKGEDGSLLPGHDA